MRVADVYIIMHTPTKLASGEKMFKKITIICEAPEKNSV